MSAEDYIDFFNEPEPYGPGHDEPHIIEGATILHETAKAFQIQSESTGLLWIPKSQVVQGWTDDSTLAVGFHGSIPISNWLASRVMSHKR